MEIKPEVPVEGTPPAAAPADPKPDPIIPPTTTAKSEPPSKGKALATAATVTLWVPYEIIDNRGDKRVLTQVTMRRPKVRDRLLVDRDASLASEGEREYRLIANIIELVPEDLAEMDLSDYRQLQEKLQGFIFPQFAS